MYSQLYSQCIANSQLYSETNSQFYTHLYSHLDNQLYSLNMLIEINGLNWCYVVSQFGQVLLCQSGEVVEPGPPGRYSSQPPVELRAG